MEQGQSVQINIMCMIRGVPLQSPALLLTFQQRTETVRLPLHITSAVSPVDQMTAQAFENNWA